MAQLTSIVTLDCLSSAKWSTEFTVVFLRNLKCLKMYRWIKDERVRGF